MSADPRELVPYHDPYEDDATDLMITLLDASNPNLADLDSFSHYSIPRSGDRENGDAIDQMADQVMWDLGVAGDHRPAAHSRGIRGETKNFPGDPQENCNGNINGNFCQSQNQEYCDYETAQPLSVWPVPALPYTCSCCQILREIIHTNGNHTMKLEVHGRLGMICHAILVNQFIVNENFDSTFHPQMFDFCNKSTNEVKHFLMEYCTDRALAGYRMLQDPLSVFYEAICVGMDWDLFNDDFFLPASPSDSGEACLASEMENQATDRNVPKTSLAAQRERTGKLTLKDFVEYFHLPIEEAAKRLNLCPTVVKKICRRGGLSRWPHRKIKSIARQMSSLRENLDSYSASERASAEAEIDKLQQEIANICHGVQG